MTRVLHARRTLVHAAVSVSSAASGAALAANDETAYGLFINDSANVIYLNVGAAAVANTGIRLNANGGSWEMSGSFGNLSTAVVNAIAVGGTSNLLVTSG